MYLKGSVTLEAEVKINDQEAAVIGLICSFDLADWFADKCSHEMTAEYIKETLWRLRQVTGKICTAKNKAMNAIAAVREEQ